jgi:DNA replication protein DnaC
MGILPDNSMRPASLDIVEKLVTCPEHGPYTTRNILRSIWTKCPSCVDEERLRQEDAERLQESKAAAERHQRAIDTARIPARFVGRTFDTFVAATDPQRHALSVVRDFSESFVANARKGAGLILSGMPGTGKSHLAAAALQSVITQDVRYLTCMDLIRAVRDTWRRDSERSETQVLSYLERLDLLVIDEVGVQYGTDGEQTILFDVLDRRYREIRPTILLTNQDKEGFKKFIGERTFDRLVETCRWVPFDWPSYRPTARKEAA